ncbi:MAG: glycosyltransferase family 2 protein [Alkalinema sp. RU_4_3]|nr:glycosyltransferase family 2 protein [Alkalinema sp. RU_4_3]
MSSFSILLETENLATADLRGLTEAIDCLAGQSPSPTQANEVLIIDSGDIPAQVKTQLLDQYPWLTFMAAPEGTTYYQAKMLGAQAATGDILLYYDSDCIYEPKWLETMLATFAEDPAIQVVAGETRTRGIGPYGTAMALAYIFPQYSEETKTFPCTQYYLNNVAFRRNFLLAHPIPTDLPLYRGNCALHAKQIIAGGGQIWRQPQARATHAPPNGLRHFYWRFLLIGHDLYWQKRLAREMQLQVSGQGQERRDPTERGLGQKLQVLDDRFGKLIRADRNHLFWLPLCLPVIAVSTSLIAIGYQIARRHPHRLLDRFETSGLG